jgi:hypothetical protein
VLSSATSSRRKSPQDPLGRRLSGIQCRYGRGEEENIFCPSRKRNRGREARNLPVYRLRYPGFPSCSLERLTLYSTGEVNATLKLYTRQGARRYRHELVLHSGHKANTVIFYRLARFISRLTADSR